MKNQANAHTIKIDYLTALLRNELLQDDAIVINEFSNLNCGARADIAIQSGKEIHAIEIKSARDSVRRLDTQLRIYINYFDRVSIVVDGIHLDYAMSLASGTVAGVTLYENGHFTVKKRSRRRLVPDNLIRKSLLPSHLKHQKPLERSARDLMIESIRHRYRDNIGVMSRIIKQGYLHASDLEALNPHFSKRLQAAQQIHESQKTWNDLILAFKDQSNHLPSTDQSAPDLSGAPA